MRFIFSAAAAIVLSIAPFGAMAVTTSTTVHYNTSYHQVSPMPSGGAYTGRLTLHFHKGGIVNGTYRDEFAGPTRTVSGGVHGTEIWLSFGGRGSHQFTGTIGKGGVITGSLSGWHGPRVYKFTATPATSP